MAATDEATTSGIATVTYDDGRVEKYDLDRPLYLYRLGQVYDTGSEGDKRSDAENMRIGMLIIWTAAGQPGLNGSSDEAAVLSAMENWLAGVAKIERKSDNPPTNRAQRRQRPRSQK